MISFEVFDETVTEHFVRQRAEMMTQIFFWGGGCCLFLN